MDDKWMKKKKVKVSKIKEKIIRNKGKWEKVGSRYIKKDREWNIK